MGRIRFERQAPVTASDPQRADVACFVGFVARRPGPVPAAVRSWLVVRSWLKSPYERPPVDELLDVPVPIDTWDAFDAVFAWERRPLAGEGRLGTYLGAAVRSFFAQGGRKAYVVRLGDPLPYGADEKERTKRLAKLLPTDMSPGDRRSWSGAGHLLGLPDVSFLCLPDLPDLVRDLPLPPQVGIEPPVPPERFVECSAPEPPPPADGWARRLAAPRCCVAGYARWVEVLSPVARLLAERLREVHLVAAVPIPLEGDPYAADLPARLSGMGSAFVQLAYPWVRTPGSLHLPEELESPDGVLAGLLARNALARGAFRSAAGLGLADVRALAPELRRDQTGRPGSDGLALIDRVSLFGPTPAGLQLLSDVTTSADPSYRPAGVSRLVSSLARAARRLGEGSAFEPAGEALWSRLQDSAAALLRALWDLGALRGATPAEAFEVRCDRSTMSQQDVDQGRTVVRVRFAAAAPVEAITVALAVDEGGQVSLASPEAA
jgi:hypothetical protein